MANFATGKRSKAISDRSGQAFPYTEMVKEWNGSLVHISEYEPKHPQIRRKHVKADRQGLQNARPQTFTENSGGGGAAYVSLSLPGDFAFQSNGMIPTDPEVQNKARESFAYAGQVTVEIS